MVNIKTYKDYWENIASRIGDLKAAYLVANEAQMKDIVANIADYPILVATVPSADPNSRDVDNMSETNTCLLFVLKKVAAADRPPGIDVDSMEQTQSAMAKVKEYMLEDFANCDAPYHNLMQYLSVGSFHQDPEYNYLGHDGWSLSFKFDVAGV